MNLIETLIGTPLGFIMGHCYDLVKNYGMAIIVFTVITKLLQFPINIWVQRNSVKMVRIQPRINEISAKYISSPAKAQQEQKILFKNEKYNPLLGLLPMVIQIFIILGLISVMYNPLKYLLHIPTDVLRAFTLEVNELAGVELGSLAPTKIIEYITGSEVVTAFRSGDISERTEAIESIRQMNLMFFGFNMINTPNIRMFNIYWLLPLISGLSSFLLCVAQNIKNVLQQEQSFFSKWATTIFLTVFSIYFAFVVPAGLGLYWILGNLISIAFLFFVNVIIDPKKHIDYEALEKSKEMLKRSKELEKSLKPTKEQRRRSKEYYDKFFDDGNKRELVYYSEKSGFYKYFEDQINYIIGNSDIVVHYITSDPNDNILNKDHPQIKPYYIDDEKLVPLYMKMDAHVMVSTTPSLNIYQYKRSLVRKDVEYIYTHHAPLSQNMIYLKGSFDNFDTIFCVGRHQIDEIREMEKYYGLKQKNLIACGYPLIDNMIKAYNDIDKTENTVKKILIAPSWQEGNILDTCLDGLLDSLLSQDYDITVRPHPEYTKRFPVNWNTITAKYADKINEHFRIEADFSSNVTIFTADMVITDWSGICFEFSYTTKKPCLFINTPQKIMNEDFNNFKCIPIEISLRNEIGMTIEPDNVAEASKITEELFANRDKYRKKIEKAMEFALFNHGTSAQVCGKYIVDAVLAKRLI